MTAPSNNGDAPNPKRAPSKRTEPEVTAKDATPARAMVRFADQPPPVLPAIILDDLVPFPGPVVPVVLDDPTRRDAVLHAKANAGYFFLVNRNRIGSESPTVPQVILSESRIGSDGRPELTTADTQDMIDAADALDEDSAEETARAKKPQEPEIGRKLRVGDLAPVGIVARVLRTFKLPDDRTSALVHLMKRAQPESILRTEPFPIMRVTYPVEIVRSDATFDALSRQLKIQLQAFFNAHTQASDELKQAVLSIEDASSLTDFVAQHLARDIAERLEFLTELDLTKRLRKALEVTVRELDLLNVGNRISQEIREKVEKTQREYLLREQLKAIRAELGDEKDPHVTAIDEIKTKLKDAGLSAAAKVRSDEELKRLQTIPTESPEHNVIRSYLETIASLPWSKVSTDSRDVKRARAILDEDHYGLEEIKDRIIEFLAVRQLNPDSRGTMLCLAGPPGVGKTSLGQSIARSLGREFFRFSVGGMRDEAEIKGHRRTYIGAMPGRILQGMRTAA
ncbi:MAG: LON peptidase substrate-binding domain-containing protein, partial [Clostridia bacterium]|nr:LON peptidase substrate-binding domain-containing protein [Deltaproteobacteria bacterium]